MDSLLVKLDDYERLKDKTLIYELINGEKNIVTFQYDNFLHLLGLHKLTDIPIILNWLNRKNYKVKYSNVIDAIRKGELKEKHIKNSYFYPFIEDRYNSFTYDNISTLTYTDAIVSFNPSIVNSKLKCDYLLFEKDINNEYNHMAIGLDTSVNVRYLETFFHEKTDSYIKGQKIIKITKFTFVDNKGNILFEDSYN